MLYNPHGSELESPGDETAGEGGHRCYANQSERIVLNFHRPFLRSKP